ncbi:uncharacterized protein LOC115229271 [Octopus sinensis]|uniref:Uncharacterized protein LOC115229271 n=1 Tax=Octopus sinensis TaxID=2607531 RepID=A0A7E6EJA5_9MOLL|nr:uncharacterized protein LOC115229271 [Octopus sinensis]
MIGAILALFGTFFHLKNPPNCQNPENCSVIAQSIYYIPLGMCFQFGWACSQISHLSLMNVISDSDEERIILNSIRRRQIKLKILFATIYAIARLITNISLIYYPVYLVYTLKLKSNESAFVYGLVSFTDKTSTGVLVVIIQTIEKL